MPVRTRLIYSKRNGACFVPHIALAQIFSRSASRAGFKLIMTQGFSPRPKISFGPELPAGVVALNEPVDMYFDDDTHEIISRMNKSSSNGLNLSQSCALDYTQEFISQMNKPIDISPQSLGESCKNSDVDYSHEIISRMNQSLPEGFNISQVLFPKEDSPSLGKSCKHAEYLLRSINNINILETSKNFYENSIININYIDNWLRIIINEPAQNPIGGLIKYMINQNIIKGWHEINIVRTAIGIYDKDNERVLMNA